MSDALKKCIEFRHWMHKHAEGERKEFNTQRHLTKALIDVAKIDASAIKPCAGTGLVVDIRGTKNIQSKKEVIKSIALRADIDGLKMKEDNAGLEYASITEYAHMCGHDGHSATLLFAACLIQSQRHLLPKDTIVRLLFQPDEETLGGAELMIKEGCLNGIQEVYGFHNTDLFAAGLVGLKSGPIMQSIADIVIRVKGKGAHSSCPTMAKDVISAGAAIVQNLHLVQSRHVPSHENFCLTITKFHGGDCNNVFPDDATLEGTIRCFSNEVYQNATAKIREIVKESVSMLGCTAEVEFNAYRPAVVNHAKQTEDVRQLVK